ncbi:helix-turn-helix domain-containing protein [Streptomyces sp. SBT349]|uniref:helix-turn-helix domain-containing protein n=1 Tax=Streptomyces sp. SBT349 TaxID=1580539 RepID=UPI00066B28C9|nr:helix-turn-helix transcriptional regulator [Streptomyces sp. SBT349]
MTGNPAGEAFAARLREVKDRSGQSFGTLARRMHVSTSTLHRYCSGAVVPADYAPVERLARLCGAGQEELVELHRLWVRAEALRSEGRSRGRSAARPDRGAEPAPERAAPERAVAEPDMAERVGSGGPVAAPPPPEPPLVPRESADWALGEPPGGDADGDVVALGRPGERGRRRGRWAVLAGIAALVLVVATVVNATISDGATDRGRDAAAPPPAAPLSWTARSHVWEGGCGHRYLVDRPVGEIPPPPIAQDAEPWAERLDAVHGDSTIVEATVRPDDAAGPVVIEALHIRVDERRAPLDWPAFDMSLGCGGALTPASFTVDLDAERPVARPSDGFDGDTGTELKPPGLPFAPTATEPLALRVSASTRTCDCSWYIELVWSGGGERGTLRVDDDGRPFRTSGNGEETAYQFAFETETWIGG